MGWLKVGRMKDNCLQYCSNEKLLRYLLYSFTMSIAGVQRGYQTYIMGTH